MLPLRVADHTPGRPRLSIVGHKGLPCLAVESHHCPASVVGVPLNVDRCPLLMSLKMTHQYVGGVDLCPKLSDSSLSKIRGLDTCPHLPAHHRTTTQYAVPPIEMTHQYAEAVDTCPNLRRVREVYTRLCLSPTTARLPRCVTYLKKHPTERGVVESTAHFYF